MILDLYSFRKFGIDIISGILYGNDQVSLLIDYGYILTAVASKSEKKTFHFLISIRIDLLDHVFGSEFCIIKSHIHILLR